MKTLRLTAFLLLIVGLTPLYSQQHAGIFAGFNITNNSVDPDGGINYESRPAIAAGGIFTIDVVEKFGFQIEPMFIQKGTKFDSEYVTPIGGSIDPYVVDAPAQVNLTYFSLAAMGRFRVGNSPVHVLAGPDIGYLRSATIGFDLDHASDSSIKDSLSSVDFGLNIGITAFIPGNKFFLVLEGLYNLGIKNISLVQNETIKNKGLQLKMGLVFPIEKRKRKVSSN